MKEIPKAFRETQKEAGIWKEHRDVFFDELNPRDGQLKGYYAITDILNGKRKLVILIGESRAGKSFLVSGYANTLLQKDFNENRGISIKYMTFFDLELALRSAQTLGRMDILYSDLVNLPHLIIDEWGRGKWSEFTSTFFTNLLIRRKGEGRDTLIATNLSGKEIREMLDIALIERLKEDDGIIQIKK